MQEWGTLKLVQLARGGDALRRRIGFPFLQVREETECGRDDERCEESGAHHLPVRKRGRTEKQMKMDGWPLLNGGKLEEWRRWAPEVDKGITLPR